MIDPESLVATFTGTGGSRPTGHTDRHIGVCPCFGVCVVPEHQTGQLNPEEMVNRASILRWVQEEIISDIADWGGPQRVWNDAANRLHELLDAAIANPSLQTSEELWQTIMGQHPGAR